MTHCLICGPRCRCIPAVLADAAEQRAMAADIETARALNEGFRIGSDEPLFTPQCEDGCANKPEGTEPWEWTCPKCGWFHHFTPYASEEERRR